MPFKCLYSFTHANFLKGHNIEHISEYENSTPLYFASLMTFLSVKEMRLNRRHLTLLHTKTRLWKMVLLFKSNISMHFCRNLNALTFQQVHVTAFDKNSVNRSLLKSLSPNFHNISCTTMPQKLNTRKSNTGFLRPSKDDRVLHIEF